MTYVMRKIIPASHLSKMLQRIMVLVFIRIQMKFHGDRQIDSLLPFRTAVFNFREITLSLLFYQKTISIAFVIAFSINIK